MGPMFLVSLVFPRVSLCFLVFFCVSLCLIEFVLVFPSVSLFFLVMSFSGPVVLWPCGFLFRGQCSQWQILYYQVLAIWLNLLSESRSIVMLGAKLQELNG